MTAPLLTLQEDVGLIEQVGIPSDRMETLAEEAMWSLPGVVEI